VAPVIRGLLIYKIDGEEITLEGTGSHADLFHE